MPHRRGRRSHDEYLESVIALIRADIWTLKDQRSFAESVGVKALATQFAAEAWPLGIALHLLIAGAVADVCGVAGAAHTRSSLRIAEFLRLWYVEERTVTTIAAGMQLSRSHVAKAIQRPALLLVAQRFLALAQHVDPQAESQGLQQALATFRRRQATGGPDRPLMPWQLGASA